MLLFFLFSCDRDNEYTLLPQIYKYFENIVFLQYLFVVLKRKCIFLTSSFVAFLLLRRRGEVEITTSSVSPEIYVYIYVYILVCAAVEVVTGGAMRRKSLAQFQCGLRSALSAAKNDYTARGEISASYSLRFSSFLIIIYRDLTACYWNKKYFISKLLVMILYEIE